MSIHVALRHVTQYRYDRAVQLLPQLVRLRPAPHCRTPILSYSQRITPSTHFLNWQQDPQSNYVARLTFPEKTDVFRVEIDLVAEMAVYNPFDFFLEPFAEQFPFAYEPSRAPRPRSRSCASIRPRLVSPPGWRRSIAGRRPTVDALVEHQPQSAAADRLRDPPRSRRADARAHARAAIRLLPRHARGCWCKFSAIWGSPRASFPAT